MKKFLVGAVITIALLAGLAGLGVAGYTYKTLLENQAATEVNETVETDLTQVAGYEPDTEEGDIVAPLQSEMQGGNVRLIWETGKVQAGTRHDFDGTWTSMGGAVVYNPEDQSLNAIELIILVKSFNKYGTDQPAPGGLITTVLGIGTPPPSGYDPWFNWVDHPNAVFAADTFTPKDDESLEDFEVPEDAVEDWTHVIEGSFDLNGTESELQIPARVAFEGDTLTIDAVFTINRSDYGVEPQRPLPLTEVDDEVKLTVSITAEPDAGVAIGALSEMVADQGTLISAMESDVEALKVMRRNFLGMQNQVADQEEEIESLEDQIEELNGQLATLRTQSQGYREQLAELIEAIENNQLANIDVPTVPEGGDPDTGTPEGTDEEVPERITVSVQYPNDEPLPFDLVLVPGDESSDIDPFYMATTEVTWEMFYDWAYGSDIDANEYANLQNRYLRPSPLYEDCDQLKLGLGNRPALSMSRTTAEAFARWVGEQTGRDFRLPTQGEWEHALELGGGVPESQEALLAQAVFEENAAEQDDPPFLFLTNEVGTTQPNALGIHDMLGNAAEWVTDTGDARLVRGGHFLLSIDDFSPDWRAVEDQSVWNATYPQLPLSEFWYRDHYYQGIRLVCEVP